MMMNQAENYTHSGEFENNSGVWVMVVILTAVLTFLTSFWWSGLALVGTSLLIFAALLIIFALIITRSSGQSAWGMAIVGQAAGVLGTAVLLWAAIS
ncbi:MAG: hypothetical protein HC804_05670 [Anaerolineae bacterium]|nr:hypothetical protein [Anaerolineae bacterium]